MNTHHEAGRTRVCAHLPPGPQFLDQAELRRELADTMGRSRRRHSRVALLVIAFDRSDPTGRERGRKADEDRWAGVALRLHEHLRPSDLLGRLEGNEFMVVIECSLERSGVEALARKLLDVASMPVGDREGPPAGDTTSIGISMFTGEESPTTAELMRDAHTAMQRARRLGGNRFCFHADDVTSSLALRRQSQATLNHAIGEGALQLHFQPRLDGRSEEVTAAEVLMRWKRGSAATPPPTALLRLANDSRLTLAIGAWVMDATCRQVRSWMSNGAPAVRVVIKVLPRQLAEGDLDAVVAWALERHRISAQYLELELPEDLLASDLQDCAAMLARVQDLGVKISLNVVSAAQDGLSNVQALPIHALKIHPGVVQRIGRNEHAEAAIDAIIALAYRLRLRVLAGGADTPEQASYLRQRGCDEISGTVAGDPMAGDELQGLLHAQARSIRP